MSAILTGRPISRMKISRPFAHGARLQDQLGRLGDAHEVAGDLRVGHGHRPSVRRSAARRRGSRTGTPERRCRTDRHEPAVLESPRSQHSSKHLGHAFGGAHDVCRPHGLVRGDEDEPLDPRSPSAGRSPDSASPRMLLQHRLPGVELLQRHVLVRRGVKHHLRFEIRKRTPQVFLRCGCRPDMPARGWTRTAGGRHFDLKQIVFAKNPAGPVRWGR